MKRQQPSGNMNRKKKKDKEEEAKALSSSMLKFIKSKASAVSETSADPNFENQDEECQNQPSQSQSPPHVDQSSQQKEGLEEKEKEKEKKRNEDNEENEAGKSDFIIDESSLAAYLDIGDWPLPVPDHLRIDLIKKGSEHFQNKEGPFKAQFRPSDSAKGKCRQLSSEWFYKNLANDEKVLRRWLTYSKTKGCLFCFCCKLFAKDGTCNFVSGFNKWWKLSPKVAEHEESPQHLASVEKWTALSARLKLNQTIDHARQRIMEKEQRKWRDILHRLLAVTLFLAKQNLPFRGHRENEQSQNKGIFLELIEFLSNYDPVLKEHLTQVRQSAEPCNRSRAMTSYLSPGTQNEFISFLGAAVKENVLQDIKQAKYYGLLLDSTPDVSHVDQMCLIIRYVHIESGQVEVRESFLEYFPLDGKGASDITNDTLKILEKDGLDIKLCRSQGYDNAATMSGIHSGVQTRIKELNPKVLFVPCANHSLNLCGVHSFASVVSSVTFFGVLENVYTFFSASTHRWDVLMEHVEISVKRVNDTRWSAHHDAVKAVMKQFHELVEAAEDLSDRRENVDTRGGAQILIANICDFSFLCYLYFWNNVLEEVNKVQKYMQISGLSLQKCVVKLRFLLLILRENRETFVDGAIQYATGLCDEMGISMEKRGRSKRKRIMPGEKAPDVGLTLPAELRRAMFHSMDHFLTELKKRLSCMESVSSKFAILETDNLINATSETLHDLATDLSEHFDELNTSGLVKEVIHLRRFLTAADVSPEKYNLWTALDFLQFVVDFHLSDSLPNLTLALRLYLTICVSVSSCERSFTKLKLIKTYLRSTMSQSRLSNLAILSIENELAHRISFEEVIDKFAKAKVRKQDF